jgi:hypothetical protein
MMIPPPPEDRPNISGQGSEKLTAPQERPDQDDRHPADHRHQQQKNPNDEKDQGFEKHRMEQGTKYGVIDNAWQGVPQVTLWLERLHK